MATTSAPSLEAVARVAWVHRRAGLGIHPDDAATAADGDDPIGALLASASESPPDPWPGQPLPREAEGRRAAIGGWLQHLLRSTTTYVDRRTLVLHGWLTSALSVAPPEAMANQIRLLMEAGGGPFPDLLRSITVDPAMLIYLDGNTSTRGAPNENYGRELLELFALGTGTAGAPTPYSEDDVQAAARALTGWVVERGASAARFVPRRHDDTPNTLLGVSDVSDVDGVIDAIVAHPEHPRFVADRIAREYVGVAEHDAVDAAPDPEVVAGLAAVYDRADRRLDAVIDAALRIADDGRAHPIVSAPMPWLLAAARTTGVQGSRLTGLSRERIQEMGQIPLLPPSVIGWPGGTRWLTASGLIARTNVAAALAAAIDDGEPVAVAVDDGDLDRLAALLGLREPFSRTTADAIADAESPTAGLALALVSPEYLLT